MRSCLMGQFTPSPFYENTGGEYTDKRRWEVEEEGKAA